MSLSGKLLRGIQWWNYRSAHNKLDHGEFKDLFLPKDILEDPHKMEEMEFYLEFVSKHDPDKVHKTLEQVKLMDLMNKPARMELEAEALTVMVTELEAKEKAEAVAAKAAEEAAAEVIEEPAIDYSKMTVSELKEALDDAEITYDSTATKAELFELTGGI